VNQEFERLLDLAGPAPAHAREELLARECQDPAVRAEAAAVLKCADEAELYFDDVVQGAASSLVNLYEPCPDDLIGSYRIKSLIGQGGMGTVYLAERADGEIEQKVAIKLLRADIHRPGWRERFLRERQLLASLQHPSVVRVLDAGHTTDGRPFLVMEVVDGLPIDRYASRLGVRQRLELFLRVCDGVSHAHRQLIIHRDLKPSNILVDAAGQPKLLDFGIAKLLNETGDATQFAEQLLTPNYASPEQLRGSPKHRYGRLLAGGGPLQTAHGRHSPREHPRSQPKGSSSPQQAGPSDSGRSGLCDQQSTPPGTRTSLPVGRRFRRRRARGS